MSREARKRAESGLYHILIKGECLFYEQQDKEEFLKAVKIYSERDFMEVYAYCLFDDISHFVIKEGLNSISGTFKDIQTYYVLWFNNKYNRNGKLFCDRFKSEPIESEKDLLDCIRFVHQLPIKRMDANIKYVFSSYNNYLGKCGIINTELVMLLLEDSPQAYRLFMEQPCENEFITGENQIKLTDEQLAAKIKEMFAGVSADELEQLSRAQWNKLLIKIKKIEGTSIRQIARVLDIGKSIVERA